MLDDRRVLVKARMMPLRTHPAGRLYSQLVDLFAYYDGFEINDHTGAPLTDEDVTSAHCVTVCFSFSVCASNTLISFCDLALSHCVGDRAAAKSSQSICRGSTPGSSRSSPRVSSRIG